MDTKTAKKNLQTHFKEIKSIDMRNLFEKETKRFQDFSCHGPEVFLDYSKNRITKKTMSHLTNLAKASKLQQKIKAMFSGKPINITENRPVLHIALRNRANTPIFVNGVDVMPQVNEVLTKIRRISEKIRNGKWRGYTNKKITDIVNIGIGGSDLGPKMVCHALQHYAHKNLRAHFVSNIDGTQITEILKNLNPETTLFIVASKTFTTLETLTNAETARKWLVKKLGNTAAVSKHFVAISTNADRVKEFGIDTKNMFEFWDWVGGRYSVWSAIGLSIAILLGMDHFEQFLTGAYEMDQHFYHASFNKNLPVILALLGIWYRNYFQTTSQAVIPYDQYLQYFTAYLQQMDMESNGKSIQIDGKNILYHTGPVIWGGIGTDCQHSFHQLFHQGTDLIPIDFIIPTQSLNPVGKHHLLLYANCLAQSQALLQGKTKKEAYQELIEKGLSEKMAGSLAKHKIMPGNRPSNTLLIEKLTPKSLGALLALYEHKVFVQGVIWNINSFDQWGVELGKQLANQIGPYLSHHDASNHFDASTQGLIDYYMLSGKNC